MKKNIHFTAAFLLALTLIFGCEQATVSNDVKNTEEEPELVVDGSEQGQATEEGEDGPQTVDARILEIKELYAKTQASTVTNAECRTNSVKDVSYDILENGFETINTAKECPLEDNLMYQRVEMNGYEWSETCYFYYQEGKRFFTYLTGGAEGCGYAYRVYYDREGEVIRVLLAENDCDGNEVSPPFEVTEDKRKQEILSAVETAEKEFNSILN